MLKIKEMLFIASKCSWLKILLSFTSISCNLGWSFQCRDGYLKGFNFKVKNNYIDVVAKIFYDICNCTELI